ncbi:uncharacterized protein LOC129602216 isoform X1 [Paramacrobiotus metropolitanus]|uniref:uncharacterized protein LOC129602216 isoform X1 n=1 Tax=Paramacrobiotus metropolitanus TaxID=2943436 RepID=UPI0024460FCE|nr:uncharacterized protein LOC129602216 isoform X1 [Paramacrobiotus metropolitanus]
MTSSTKQYVNRLDSRILFANYAFILGILQITMGTALLAIDLTGALGFFKVRRDEKLITYDIAFGVVFDVFFIICGTFGILLARPCRNGETAPSRRSTLTRSAVINALAAAGHVFFLALNIYIVIMSCQHELYVKVLVQGCVLLALHVIALLITGLQLTIIGMNLRNVGAVILVRSAETPAVSA